jgi:hypothetical protein
LFQEIIDRLEQDHIQPILCHEPPSFFSPSEHPLEDEHREHDPEKMFGCSVRSRVSRGSLPCARVRTSARTNSATRAAATTTVPGLRLMTTLSSSSSRP